MTYEPHYHVKYFIMQLKVTAQLKILGALLGNMVIPGAGFISSGHYRIGIAIQALLAGSLVISCWTRLILTPNGCKALLMLVALIYFFNTTFLIVIILKDRPRWTVKNLFLALMFSVTCLAAFALGFKTKDQWLGVHVNFVPSGSMQPTLLPGDFILVDYRHYKQHPIVLDDVVVFKLPRHEELAVKRVKNWPDQKLTHGNQFYLLGDNKRFSHDSRALGGIKPKWILGKVSLVLFSFDRQWNWREQRALKVIQ
jgi:signal peptidase I